MFLHPESILFLAHERERELIADADRSRLRAAARRARRARRESVGRGGRHAADRAAPAGTLAPCGPSAAAPAQ